MVQKAYRSLTVLKGNKAIVKLQEFLKENVSVELVLTEGTGQKVEPSRTL